MTTIDLSNRILRSDAFHFRNPATRQLEAITVTVLGDYTVLVSDPWDPAAMSPAEASGLARMSEGQKQAARVKAEELRQRVIVGAEKDAAERCPTCPKDEQPESSDGEPEHDDKPGLLRRLARGVPGLLKAELGLDVANAEAIAGRRATCLVCPSGCYDFGVCDTARGGCGCYLAAKVRVASEQCPKGHW
jgi:hypothetical protein